MNAAQNTPQRLAVAFPDGEGFTWHEFIATGNVLFLGEAPDPEPVDTPEPLPEKIDWSDLLRYSQNNVLWRNFEYAGGTTFGTAGCFVVCVAMLAQIVYGITFMDPVDTAKLLRKAGAFNGNLLSNLENIPVAFPDLMLKSPETRGAIHYRDTAADMEYIAAELVNGPLIAEVAFDPKRKVFDGKSWNQHFVLIVSVDLEADTAMIADPWDGELKQLTTSRYALSGWKASRIITGLRLVRLA
jgi:hypothetical protein